MKINMAKSQKNFIRLLNGKCMCDCVKAVIQSAFQLIATYHDEEKKLYGFLESLKRSTHFKLCINSLFFFIRENSKIRIFTVIKLSKFLKSLS